MLQDRGVQLQLVLALIAPHLFLNVTPDGVVKWVHISPLVGPMFQPAFHVLVQPPRVIRRPMWSGFVLHEDEWLLLPAGSNRDLRVLMRENLLSIQFSVDEGFFRQKIRHQSALLADAPSDHLGQPVIRDAAYNDAAVHLRLHIARYEDSVIPRSLRAGGRREDFLV